MSFLLKSVELSNIRSHEHVIFKPSTNGVTSILGKNGTGKSTIVDSIAWCLFGTKIGGVKNSAIMKSGVEYKKDSFYAKVIIEVDGQDLLVVRKFVSKTGTVAADVYRVDPEYYEEKEDSDCEAEVNEDAPEKGLYRLAGPGVSHVERYLRQRLKMDEKGFLSSILVQQKEVDQLISATASVRAKVIEDLTGITSITHALSSAREEYNALKKASTYSHADEEGIKKGEETLADIVEQMQGKKEKFLSHQKRVEELKTEGTQLANKLKYAKSLIAKKRALESEIAVVQSSYNTKVEDRDNLLQERNERKKELGGNTSAENAKKILADKEEAQKLYNKSQVEIQRLQTELKGLESNLNTQKEVMGELVYDDKTSEVLLDQIGSNKEQLQEKVDKVTALESQNISLAQSNSSLNTAIKVLSTDDGECPTCLQKVSNPENAIHELQRKVEDDTSTIENNKQLVKELSVEIATTKDQISTLEKQETAYHRVVELSQQIKEKNIEIELAHGVERDHYENLQSISKRADNASNIVYKLEEYQKVLTKAQQASKDANALKSKLDELTEEIKSIKDVSEETILKAEERLEKKRKQYSDFSTAAVSVKGEIDTLAERKKSEESMLKKLKEDFDKHKKLMENLSIAASTVKITEEFRKNRIDNSIPVIGNYASNFISRFTDNKFVKLTMDNKFNASVVLLDGTVRPVSALSGGELSAAAIALRLAISMLLGGSGEKSSIILDEVLVSMSSDRSENILYTIKDMSQGQIIMISHSDLTTEISDYIFDLDAEKDSSVA